VTEPSTGRKSALPTHKHIDGSALSRLYRERFAEEDLEFKSRAWRILCDRIFQRHVDPADTVLDLGAGRCEFINAIRAKDKIAVDLNPDVAEHAIDARVALQSSTDMSEVENDSVDVVFSSNFLEHLPTKEAVLETLVECRRILRASGTLIILMPNMRYLHGRYWDYFDHHTPLTHNSLAEALGLTGFDVVSLAPRFLPYTVKQRTLPHSVVLLKLYLRMPWVWRFVGRQMLVVGRLR